MEFLIMVVAVIAIALGAWIFLGGVGSTAQDEIMDRRVPGMTKIMISAPSTANVGDTVEVTVKIVGARNLFLYIMYLNFNNAVLNHQPATQGDFLAGGWFGSNFIPPNKIGCAAYKTDVDGNFIGTSGSGILFKVEFIANSEGTSEFTLSDIQLFDPTMTPITDYYVDSDSITINP